MSSTKTPIEQAQERYPELDRAETHTGYTDREREAYAACLEERAIPAEQALRVAMDYIKAPNDPSPGCHIKINEAYEALRANPITAKMLEE